MEGDVRTFTIDPHGDRVVYPQASSDSAFPQPGRSHEVEPVDSMLDCPTRSQKRWDVPARLRGID